jgi:hypothetical protein
VKRHIISRDIDKDGSQRRVTSRLVRHKLSGDGARQKPLYASTTPAFFDISDVFDGIRSRSLAIYPIRLSSRDCFFSLRIKFEDTTDWIVERVLRA